MSLKTLKRNEINRAVRSDPAGYVGDCCAQLTAQIDAAAAQIGANRARSPIVLLSGPTGSGKTTSAALIARALGRRGVGAHVVSLDDYFLDVTPELTPRDEAGNYDFESPLCLDLELLGRHFDQLSRGEAIDVPSFDFAAQARAPGVTETIRPRADEVVLFEGIHALGELVGGRHPEAERVFVNVASDILDETGEVCFWASRLRMARRLVRDYRSRGASPELTLALWDNVRSNEKRTLLAQQDRADLLIDTTLGYEPGVLRETALPLLRQVDPTANRYEQVLKMIERFELFEPVEPALLPADALTREFIGGGIWG